MNMKRFAKLASITILLLGFSTTALSDQSADTWEKVVFHVDETANARWSLMLARSYLDDAPKAKIVLVVYGPGVDFLIEDAQDRRGNPYDHAVETLIDRGVAFRVCATTLSARSIPKENLLEGVSIVPSGISEIVRLQIKEGYAYLKP